MYFDISAFKYKYLEYILYVKIFDQRETLIMFVGVVALRFQPHTTVCMYVCGIGSVVSHFLQT